MGDRPVARAGSGRWRGGTDHRVRTVLAVAVAGLLVTGSAVTAARTPSAPVVALAGTHDRADHRQDATQAPIAPTGGGVTSAAGPTPVPAATPPAASAPTATPTPRTTTQPPTPPVQPEEQPGTFAPATDPQPREAFVTGFSPFASVAGIVLHHPADVVERIGLHQSNHEGARDLDVLETAAAPLVLESRDRLSGERSAADVVVDPTGEIRSPVTGTVIRAGSYTLYCDLTDEYAVIAPDAQPSWEVKVLHVVGLHVAVGDRVEAGVTPLAAHAHVLPFASQVDEWTAEPSWPHTHVEVVDPSIPNQPNPGSGYDDCP
ncbi:hypothetical protein [Euzebya rosea]|uniref:hypothetical protein n=1 Tax=Euzebya rosea TaxID=2052804 RepID=UPI000D3E40B9|nr:hypothetical protein [Euzebya rosea]